MHNNENSKIFSIHNNQKLNELILEKLIFYSFVTVCMLWYNLQLLNNFLILSQTVFSIFVQVLYILYSGNCVPLLKLFFEHFFYYFFYIFYKFFKTF